MKLLLAPTEDFIKRERTSLASDATAGSTVTLTVINNNMISANDFIVIGYEGGEKAELVQVSSVSGSTSIIVPTLKFNHGAQEPITKYQYDKRKFYGSTSIDGSYSELSSDGSPVLIQVDDPQGTYIEYSGSTYTYFKSTYFNSYESIETDISDAVAIEADDTIRYCSIYSIRKQSGMIGNSLYSDLRVEQKRTQAEGEIKSAIGSRYSLPLSEVPHIISYICEILAAGYIDYEEFGSDGQGVKLLGEARGLLKAIKEGRQLLLASDDTELARVGSSGTLSGYPNDSVSDTDTDAKIFKMSDRF